ncbi:RICIN domain-containing protein [Streptomyces griseorubiginosus]|uniref:Ricin B lectin domain-containing protein n=1 Tax=Streptomyces griseorubiginosus TaxID=67304 RepID=A0AAI8LAA7_9ACTN|nr:RICIN domain-containing protein [Streptomyces griseorubiginosus]AYC43883.1 hypothetical protein DWG14_08191 [Streptomyces griseorubiginosus]
MQSLHPPRPPYPPRPGLIPGATDRELSSRLSDRGPGRQAAIAVLLARHWPSARDYALLCLASATPTAPLAATSAFHQLLDRLEEGGPAGALRPQLLVMVRETIRAWAADDDVCAAMPELHKPTGGRGLHLAQSGTAAHRKLAERAFVALPEIAQCLLWHTEVEAEAIDIPAGLTGVDKTTATASLEQAREQFRTGIVRAHRELAPSSECRFHNRLIDVAVGRGAELPQDVRHHLTQCSYCRAAVEQLSCFDGGLEVLLAEAVLGWGGRRYAASRPGRSGPADWAATGTGTGPVPGRHRSGGDGRQRAMVAVGTGLTSLALLAGILAVRGWSDDGPGHLAEPAWGGATTAAPDHGTPSASSSPSTASAVGSGAETDGRLHNAATGLCLDVEGALDSGAHLRLAQCSSSLSQEWSYEFDGSLRSGADPSLCLTADAAGGKVRLASCDEQDAATVYVLSAGGEILLDEHQGLALAAEPGTAPPRVVVTERDGSQEQRWSFDDEDEPSSRT